MPWPIYAQDPWPLHEEPLATAGAACAKCRIRLTEEEERIKPSSNNAVSAEAKQTQYVWKCRRCKFSILKNQSMETMYEHMLEKAQEKLEYRKSEKKSAVYSTVDSVRSGYSWKQHLQSCREQNAS